MKYLVNNASFKWIGAFPHYRYVEELVRLPDNFHCCTPSPKAGPVCLTPALCNGFVTFGSFNNLAKVVIFLNISCNYILIINNIVKGKSCIP